MRRQRGGAAVVLGALSPRTRNAQVALYQSGEVDFLVATDAIGMGINMDVDHVAFAETTKFDGMRVRSLRPDEMGQIAGRAGRHMNDGTFGVTAEAEPLDEETVARIESHRYEPVRILQWRNSALSFRSLGALIESLEEPPPLRGLVKARPAMDFASLRILAGQDDFRALASSPGNVKRLWEACQLPDFRKLTPDEHVRLVGQIYRHLMSDDGVLPEDWLARQVSRLDEIEGDVATLSGRLAQIRTWTYAAHRPGWVKDAGHWQEQTRAVEDRLSDALHERLTQRFIDRRTAILMRRLRDHDVVNIVLDKSGAVAIGGEIVGKLEGFRFSPDPRAEGIHGRTLRAAALRGLEGEFVARARRISRSEDAAITLSEHGRLWWDGAIVAQLIPGPSALQPTVSLLADEHLAADLRDNVQHRLDAWITNRIATRVEPLLALRSAADAKPGTARALPAEARGIAHQLCENLGSLDRTSATVPPDLRIAMHALRAFGVKFGKRAIFMPKLLRPEAASLLALLWGVRAKLDRVPPPPVPGITSFDADDGAPPPGFLAAAGFLLVGPRAIRLDMLERLEQELGNAATTGQAADAAVPKLVSLLGCDRATLDDVLAALGWSRVTVSGEASPSVWRQAQPRVRHRRRGRRPLPTPRPSPDSPFAGLAALIAAD